MLGKAADGLGPKKKKKMKREKDKSPGLADNGKGDLVTTPLLGFSSCMMPVNLSFVSVGSPTRARCDNGAWFCGQPYQLSRSVRKGDFS